MAAFAWLLCPSVLSGQTAGATRTQEIYSSTGHVKIDNSINSAVVTVTYAAATTFTASSGDHFKETLTGNVTSSTLSAPVAGTNYYFTICQDSTGGRTFAEPSNFVGWQSIASAASSCTTQSGYYDGTNVNFPVSGASTSNSAATSNGLISGCGVFYSGTGMVFTVTRCNYQIGGVVYSSPQTDVTLSNGDATYSRVDVFYVDNTGAAGHLTGTPSATPIEPSVDPLTQINIGFLTVPAGATSPSGVTTTVVYKENAGSPTEWNCTVSGTDFACNDTAHPFAGTLDIASAGLNISDYAKLTIGSGSVAPTDYNVLIAELYSPSAWTGKDEVWITLYSGTSAVGNTVFASSNNYGWNGAIAATYQAVVIPISAFGLASTDTFDNIRIAWNNGGRKAAGQAMYFDNIELQQNGVSGGSGASSSGVTSVCMSGDGVVYKVAVPGSCVTSSGTLIPTLANANAGYVLAGPIGSLGTNVGVRQFVHCTHSTAVNADTNKSFSCPAFSNTIAAGDSLLVVAPGTNNNTTAGFTDSLGNTFAVHASGGSSPSLGAIAFAAITTGGSDVVSGTGIHWWDNGGAWSQYDFWVLELTGASALSLAYIAEGVGGSNPYSLPQAITPGASTDALIRLGIIGSNNVGTPSTGTATMSPVGSGVSTFTSADVNMGHGILDFYAPGSTASVSNTVTYNDTAGAAPIYYFLLADVTQSASAGSAPWAARRLGEGDLPASAVSAIQSVSKFNIAAIVNLPSNTNTTVISQTITMPSDGCPCRVFANYSGYEAVGGSGTVTSWISDGTNDGATTQANTTDATSMPIVGQGWFGPYVNGLPVTFTWKVNPGTYATGTYQMNVGFAASTSAESGHMTLTVMQSRN